MKVKDIHLHNFKRFADLKIMDIQPTVKLVVLLGPNGCGKSSLFDAAMVKSGELKQEGLFYEHDYHSHKASGVALPISPVINFHGDVHARKAIYVRTAYRNEPVVEIGSLSVMGSVLDERRFSKIIENDVATSVNYQRLASDALERGFDRGARDKTLGEYQDDTLGEIQKAMKRLFHGLVLNSLGNPLKNKTFTFDKGESKNFPYKNLSGGEKAAFDLLLDVFVKRNEYDNTVFFIDEPEAHMNPRLQGKLLEEILALIGDESQLWVATHAIGMMRKALELHKNNPDAVAFLDFGDLDFDVPQVIKPTIPNREFWEKIHKVILDDLGALIVPGQIILCEGVQGEEGFDAECYNKIFSIEFPDAKFISAGGKLGLGNYIQVIRAVTEGAEVFGLRDRDSATEEEIAQTEQKGIKTLKRHEIENYLLHDDVLYALCTKFWPADCQEKFDALVGLRSTHGDCHAKAASHSVFQRVQSWGAQNIGSNHRNFLRYTLAPLVKPGMATYEELKAIIFGSSNAPTA